MFCYFYKEPFYVEKKDIICLCVTHCNSVICVLDKPGYLFLAKSFKNTEQVCCAIDELIEQYFKPSGDLFPRVKFDAYWLEVVFPEVAEMQTFEHLFCCAALIPLPVFKSEYEAKNSVTESLKDIEKLTVCSGCGKGLLYLSHVKLTIKAFFSIRGYERIASIYNFCGKCASEIKMLLNKHNQKL